MSDDEIEARRIRREWMTLQGLDADEIDEYMLSDPPVSVAEEQEHLDAWHRLEVLNARIDAMGKV